MIIAMTDHRALGYGQVKAFERKGIKEREREREREREGIKEVKFQKCQS